MPVGGVGSIDQPALVANAVDHLLNRQDVGNALGQEEPDQLTGPRPHLLANHHAGADAVLECPPGAVHGVVVGDAHDVEPDLGNPRGELLERRAGVA